MDKKIKKYFKSYLSGKKYFDNDNDKSYEYFKQCIIILDDIKNNQEEIDSNIINIINETETECCKYLTLTIENTIEKPIDIIKIDYNKELFDIIETGEINKLKNKKYGEINFNILNENGLTPLHYAIKFGDTTFIKECFKLGASIDLTNKFGHTLLEYACLEKDPNIVNFLLLNGCDIKKHVQFREGKKYFNKGNQIDILLLQKNILNTNQRRNEIKYLDFVLNYINNISLDYCETNNTTISKEKISIENFLIKFDNYLDEINIDYRNTYIDIIKEELSYNLSNKLGCPQDKMDILLSNLVPFIDYGYIRLNWIISLEIKYIILKILKNKIKINTEELKNELSEILYLTYIKPDLLPNGIIENLVLQWFSKIKV